MNTFVIEEFFVDEKNACNFYTVRLEDRNMSETDRFYEQFENHKDFREDFGMIHALINELGKRGMQVIRRARDESKTFALPPELLNKELEMDVFENKLRLYYVLINQNIVVLLGGGIAHEDIGRNVPPTFWEAQMFAKKIFAAGSEAYQIDGNLLLPAYNEDSITIY